MEKEFNPKLKQHSNFLAFLQTIDDTKIDIRLFRIEYDKQLKTHKLKTRDGKKTLYFHEDSREFLFFDEYMQAKHIKQGD